MNSRERPIWDVFASVSQRMPREIAYEFEGSSITYAQLCRKALDRSKWLEPVEILSRGNDPTDFLVTLLAATYRGSTLVINRSHSYPGTFCEILSGGAGLQLFLPTSGTTSGASEFIRHDEAYIYASTLNSIDALGLRDGDRMFISGELHHVGALYIQVLPCLLAGIPIFHSRFNAFGMASSLTVGKPTMAHFSPWQTQILSLSGFFDQCLPELSLRRIVMGSSPVVERYVNLWLARGVDVQCNYGLTQAGPMILGKHFECGSSTDCFQNRAYLGDSTRCEWKLIDGVLSLRGECVVPNCDDGWLRTNDLIEKTGPHFYFLGRVDDRITIGNTIIDPVSVEAKIYSVDGVWDCVFGYEAGESCVLKVVTHLKDRHGLEKLILESLKDFDFPFKISFVERIPRNEIGKVVRHNANCTV